MLSTQMVITILTACFIHGAFEPHVPEKSTPCVRAYNDTFYEGVFEVPCGVSVSKTQKILFKFKEEQPELRSFCLRDPATESWFVARDDLVEKTDTYDLVVCHRKIKVNIDPAYLNDPLDHLRGHYIPLVLVKWTNITTLLQYTRFTLSRTRFYRSGMVKLDNLDTASIFTQGNDELRRDEQLYNRSIFGLYPEDTPLNLFLRPSSSSHKPYYIPTVTTEKP